MREVFLIGFPLHPDVDATFYSHSESCSLDDADIVMVVPLGIPSTTRSYQGKPSLSENKSFQIEQASKHLKRELKKAIQDGKTIFFVASMPEWAFIDTGERAYSGTGKNRQITMMVKPFDNYELLPFLLPTREVATGTAMKLAPKAQLINPFWQEFRDYVQYEVKFSPSNEWIPLILTKTGNRSTAIRRTIGPGNVLVLPPINYFYNAYHEYEERQGSRRKKYDSDEWYSEDDYRAKSHRLLQILLDLDASLRENQTVESAPDWIDQPAFSTSLILETRHAIREVDLQIDQLQEQRAGLQEQHRRAKVLQDLLFAKGVALERSVLKALSLFGFSAEHYTDGESEFDAVFMADNRRLIGEVEGKDNSPIAIDKITQLERNVAEDYEREEVLEYAKGVLFGNPPRLLAPDERDVDFTTKCFSSAKRNGFALLLTAAMFSPAAYLETSSDAAYAAACRGAILNTSGDIVSFPEPPDSSSKVKTVKRARKAET